MESKEQLLMQLLTATARTLTHLTASVTSMSFELMRSDDEVTCSSGRLMVERMTRISSELTEHWRLIAELGGEQPPHEPCEVRHDLTTPPPPPVLPFN